MNLMMMKKTKQLFLSLRGVIDEAIYFRKSDRHVTPFLAMTISFFLLAFCFNLSPIHAQHFTSPTYRIDWGNFNMTSGGKTSPSFNLTDTVGQNAPGQYDNIGNGLQIKSGFQYIYDITLPFTFKISSLAINFGNLVPSVGTTASHNITITTPSTRGYEVLAAENHPLQISPTQKIIDTLGDNNLCSQSNSDTWINDTTYGFGFNALGINSSGVVTGVGTSQYFTNATYYRQFADASSSESPQVIMSESNRTTSSSARITYKVNISSVQTAGNYENAITFIAIPKY